MVSHDDAPPADEAKAPTDPALDELFRSLAAAHRRVTVQYLATFDGDSVSLTDLADHVAGQLAAAEGSVTDAGRDRVRAQLHHHHLPQLADAEIIDYDRDARRITFAENAEAVTPHLRLAQQYD